MSANVPEQHALADGDAPAPMRRSARRWRWVVAVLVLLVGAVLLVQAWGAGDGGAPPGVSDSGAGLVSPAPSAPPTAPSFDAADLGTLFVTAGDLEDAVPAAADGIEALTLGDEASWGLSPGMSVSPAECLVAATVVAQPPVEYAVRAWGGAEVVFEQQVTLLASAEAAEDAFRTLVTVVDACPEYSLLGPEGESALVRTSPAIEDQGFFPSLAQRAEVARADASTQAQVRGHLLVGNAILTWTASTPADGDADKARERLGAEATLDAMVQARARAAAVALP